MRTDRRGPRQRIAPGLYRDALGHEVRASAAGQTRSKRFPTSATRKAMRIWQDDTRRDLRAAARARASDFPAGTLAGDIARHVATLPTQRRLTTVADYSAWLTPALRDQPRRGITLDQLRAVVTGWINTGLAASTINHRRRALVALYEAIDGTDPPVLPRRLGRQREPAPEPRAVDMATLDAIIGGMPDYPHAERHQRNKSKARLRFMLWTATTPAAMKRMGPHAVDLERKELTKPARAKGRGAPAVTLPLIEPDGVEAARAWLRAFAWGPFNASVLNVRFKSAVRAYTTREQAAGRAVHLPPTLRLYDLRHSFLTWLAERTATDATPGGNPLVVQHYAQHADLTTTKRYMLAAIPGMVRAALAVPRPVPRK